MLRVSLSLVLVVMTAAAHADVYKYVDGTGRTQYTDKPQTLPAERLNLQSRRSDVVDASKRSQVDSKSEAQKPGVQQGNQKEAEELTAQDKADRCSKARERYDKYVTSQRLYEPGADGERRYLSSVEIDAARASAKAAMDELCK